jgi:putative hydrolase of the HAD superfamily
MIRAVLFDLGGTLVDYYSQAEFPFILRQSIFLVRHYLDVSGRSLPSQVDMWKRVDDENYTSPDFRVRPLEDRLARIFDINPAEGAVIDTMCRAFMKPIFVRGMCFQDSVPVLEWLRMRGMLTAIVSNTPWGSPSHLWREELTRLDLEPFVDAMVFCRDAGWRKPAPEVFQMAIENLGVTPAETLFVGDHPQWDVKGAQSAGIEPVLIDRTGTGETSGVCSIGSLVDLPVKFGLV